MKLTKYRIVRDSYAGYEVQKWRVWFPFWLQCFSGRVICNTHSSIEDAKQFIEWHKKNKVVWEEA